jgi:hypothetical protein
MEHSNDRGYSRLLGFVLYPKSPPPIDEARINSVEAVLNTLTPREENIIRRRFGLCGVPVETLEQIGQSPDFRVTRERIRQIESKALRKLRHPSRLHRLINLTKVSQEELKVIRTDLTRALRYLELLEAAKSTDVPKAQAPALKREALSLAAVVAAYCRPFTACHRRNEKKKRPWIPQDLLKDLPDECQQLHREMMADRNQLWAHTDENEVRDQMRNTLPLKKDVIPRFKALIKEVSDRLHT